MRLTMATAVLLGFVGGVAVQTKTEIVDPSRPFGPLRFERILQPFGSSVAASERSGYGVALRHTAGNAAWKRFGRNTWRGKANADWLPSEWLTFGSAKSQRPHAGLFIDRARDQLRFAPDVEAKARQTRAFMPFEVVFDKERRELETSVGRFETILFGYKLPGAGVKNCVFFLANAVAQRANMGGYICRPGVEPVSDETLRCFIDTVRVPDLNIAGTPAHDCDSGAPARLASVLYQPHAPDVPFQRQKRS